MTNTVVWAVSESEVVAELGGSGSGRVQIIRAPGALGVRPLVVFREIDPTIVRARDLRADTAQRILRSIDISHPGWVRIHGTLRVGRRTGLVMELVAGCTLDELGTGALEPGAIEHVAAKVAGVLESLHRGRDALGRPLRLVHGSVTPDKIMLSFAGDVKLIDFGVTASTHRALDAYEHWPDELLPWVPPELLDDAHAPDAGSDLYMLGATLYLLLTGQPPYAPGQGFDMRAWPKVPRPSKFRPDIRPVLDDLVMSMLDPNPSHRPVSAQEVRETLEARPARTALSAVVRDNMPERLREIEALHSMVPSQAPLVLATPEDEDLVPATTEPPAEPPTLREPAAEVYQQLVAVPPEAPRAPARPLPAVRTSPSRPPAPVRAPAPAPARPSRDHVGHDSIELLRMSVKRIFDAPSGIMRAPPEVLALPAMTEDPRHTSDVEPSMDLVPTMRPRYRRPVGLLMLLLSALALTWLTDAHPEDGTLDVRIDPPEAVVEIRDFPAAGAFSHLPPGLHHVRASAPGRAPAEVAVQVGAAEHRVLLVTLPPAP